MGFKRPKKSLRCTGICSKCLTRVTGARIKTLCLSAPGKTLRLRPVESILMVHMASSNDPPWLTWMEMGSILQTSIPNTKILYLLLLLKESSTSASCFLLKEWIQSSYPVICWWFQLHMEEVSSWPDLKAQGRLNHSVCVSSWPRLWNSSRVMEGVHCYPGD